MKDKICERIWVVIWHLLVLRCLWRSSKWISLTLVTRSRHFSSILDDIFLLWDNSLNDLQLFVDSINTYHPNIHFTHTISKQTVSFLDVLITMMIWQYRQTYISKKQTPINIWTIYRVTQNSVKTEFPTAKLRRIIYNDDCFIESLRELKQYCIDKGYPENAIKTSFDKVSKMSQENTLHQYRKDKTCMLPIVTVHNTSLLNIGATLHKNWDILNYLQKTKSSDYTRT